MKQFIAKSVVFLLLLVCSVLVMNRLLCPNALQVEKSRIDEILSDRSSIEAVCLGRSHAASLDYDAIGVHGANLAMGGRDLASIEFWLDTMVPHLPHLREVDISISYSSLYFDNKAFGSGVVDARVALYHSLPTMHFMSGDRGDFLVGKFFTFIHPDHGREALLAMLGKRQGLMGGGAYAENYMPESKMDENATYQAYIHSADRNRASRNDPDVIRKNVECISRIHKKLAERRIRCVFFTPPYHLYYTKHFPQEDIKEMKQAMQELHDREGVVYLDYSVTGGISSDVTYFHNADHLNGRGKEAFSKMFEKWLREGD